MSFASAAGCSISRKWPAPSITLRRFLGSARAYCSPTPTGTIRSCRPHTIKASEWTPPSSGGRVGLYM